MVQGIAPEYGLMVVEAILVVGRVEVTDVVTLVVRRFCVLVVVSACLPVR